MKTFPKQILSLVLTLGLILTAGLSSACQNTQEASKKNTLKIAASPRPHAEILEQAKIILREEGIELEIVEFTDYVLPNRAVQEGDVDANYFQHQPYLNQYNDENSSELLALGPVHYEPFALYSGNSKSLAKVKDGDIIGVPNDVSNQARALLLLADAGLITLPENADAFSVSVLDIVENPHNLKFEELAAAQLPRSLADLDYAVINGNYALEAGLSVTKDALFAEQSDSLAAQTYANILATSQEKKDNPSLKRLYEVLQSDEIKEFLEKEYQGAVVAIDN